MIFIKVFDAEIYWRVGRKHENQNIWRRMEPNSREDLDLWRGVGEILEKNGKETDRDGRRVGWKWRNPNVWQRIEPNSREDLDLWRGVRKFGKEWKKDWDGRRVGRKCRNRNAWQRIEPNLREDLDLRRGVGEFWKRTEKRLIEMAGVLEGNVGTSMYDRG